jgi:hypothetical protein
MMNNLRNRHLPQILIGCLILLVATTSITHADQVVSSPSSAISGDATSTECTPWGLKIPGDLDGDGQVNTTDVQLLKDIIFEINPSKPDADINSDGTIDVTDLQALVNISLNPQNLPPIPEGDLHVSKSGNDNNSGTESEPLQTIQEAILRSTDSDIIIIKPGTYDLAKFSRTIDHRLSFVGVDKCATILTNGGTLNFLTGFSISNLTFKDYDERVFGLDGGVNDVIDGVTLENNRFENLTHVIRSYTDGTLTNVLIDNNQFIDLITEDGKVQVIRLDMGIISNITVSNNSFINLISRSETKSTVAIKLGDNINRDTTRDIFVINNRFENLVGGTVSIDPTGNEFPGIHAVLAFGENINILYNTVREVTYGKDHEAIYIKASHSTIAHNVVHNGGSNGGGDGDITIKGGPNFNNLVYGNRVTGDQAGTGITVHGEVRIENNYVNKRASSGRHAINVYAQEMPVIVLNNHIETELGGSALRIDGANGVEINDNLIINHTTTNLTIRLRQSTNVRQSGNIECLGASCGDLTPPNPTCQNQGFVCCDSCELGTQGEYTGTCAPGKQCCDPLF